MGPNILAQVADVYRKLRFTLRFLLGNVADFEPDQDAVPYDALPATDRYVLANFSQLLGGLAESYDAFQFSRVYQACRPLAPPAFPMQHCQYQACRPLASPAHLVQQNQLLPSVRTGSLHAKTQSCGNSPAGYGMLGARQAHKAAVSSLLWLSATRGHATLMLLLPGSHSEDDCDYDLNCVYGRPCSASWWPTCPTGTWTSSRTASTSPRPAPSTAAPPRPCWPRCCRRVRPLLAYVWKQRPF